MQGPRRRGGPGHRGGRRDGLGRCSLAVQGQVGKLSCPTFFVVVYVCKRSEVIIIVVIVCYGQVRSGRGERPWMQALLSRRPWRLHASPHGRFFSGGKISAGVSLRTPSLSEWPGLGLS